VGSGLVLRRLKTLPTPGGTPGHSRCLAPVEPPEHDGIVMRTLKLLVVSSRPLSWVNTAIPFGLAYFAVAGGVDAILVVGFIFFLIPYNFLMYGINDVFDYESDLKNPRKGGIEGALLPPELHRTTVIASSVLPIPFLIPLVGWGSLEANGVLALALFVVVAYSAKGFRFKEIPFLDSVSSSLHFVLPAVYGIVLAGGRFDGLLALALGRSFCGGWRLTRLAPCRMSWRIARLGLVPLQR
jgi:4-hydroxybenzoate polyprenyltransferase